MESEVKVTTAPDDVPARNEVSSNEAQTQGGLTAEATDGGPPDRAMPEGSPVVINEKDYATPTMGTSAATSMESKGGALTPSVAGGGGGRRGSYGGRTSIGGTEMGGNEESAMKVPRSYVCGDIRAQMIPKKRGADQAPLPWTPHIAEPHVPDLIHGIDKEGFPTTYKEKQKHQNSMMFPVLTPQDKMALEKTNPDLTKPYERTRVAEWFWACKRERVPKTVSQTLSMTQTLYMSSSIYTYTTHLYVNVHTSTFMYTYADCQLVKVHFPLWN